MKDDAGKIVNERVCGICGANTGSRDRWMHTVPIPGREGQKEGWSVQENRYIHAVNIACDACWDAHCQQEKGKSAHEVYEAEAAKIAAQNAKLGKHIGDEVYDRHYKGE